jgi:hypothetical protein
MTPPEAILPYSDNVVTVNKTSLVLNSSHPLGEDVLRLERKMEARLFAGAARSGMLWSDPDPERPR